MQIIKVLLAEIAMVLICLTSAYSQNRAEWMAQTRWGVMTHYLADWKSRDYNIEMNVDEWNKLIDKFDVEKLAEQLPLTQRYPSHLQRVLQPAHEMLLASGLLRDASFRQISRAWFVDYLLASRVV